MRIQNNLILFSVVRLCYLTVIQAIKSREASDLSVALRNQITSGLLWANCCLLPLIFFLSVFLSVTTCYSQQIAAGGYHSLFTCVNNTVRGCGSSNYGQLGNNDTATQITTTRQIEGLTGITDVAAGWTHSLFLKDDRTVWACGWNNFGQLGDGTTTNRLNPVQVAGLTGIIAIAAGGGHSLFLKNDGTVWACGRNGLGQLGDGTVTDKLTPIQVNSLTNIIAIAAGDAHSLFLKNDGTVWACG